MNDSRFEDLSSRLLDDELTTGELTELSRLAEGHPERQEELRSQLRVADMIAQAEDELRAGPRFVAATLNRLGDLAFVAGVREAIAGGGGRKAVSWQRPNLRWRWVVAVAGSVAVATIVALLRQRAEPKMARITALNGSTQWTGDGGQVKVDLEAGRAVGGGTLESLSAESWAVLEFRDGSTVTVFGQSMLTIAEGAQKELHLRQGSLSASVVHQPAGKSMIIHTPAAKLEILGTQLNVVAGPSSTVINVNEGRVRATRLVDGRVAEVTADHQIVASLNHLVDYKARRRPDPVHWWKSTLPKDAKYGQWLPGENGRGDALRSTPLLLTRDRPKPLLIHLTAFSVDSDDSPPVVLNAGGRFRIRGRMEETGVLYFGLTMNRPKGGFAGKYVAARKIELSKNPGEGFDIEFGLEEFKPEKADFPRMPTELELVDCWCLTVHQDLGLRINRVELDSVKP